MPDEYQLDKEAAQVNSIINGAVVANAPTNLTEAEKAQARENIGATPIGTSIHPVAHYTSLNALTQADPSHDYAYSVGSSTPYNLYFWDARTGSWLNYGAIRGTDLTARIVNNVSVARNAWSSDSQHLFSGYGMKADITVSGISSNDFPIVVFDAVNAISGNFCPAATSSNGKIQIYARETPTGAITLPSVTFIVIGG